MLEDGIAEWATFAAYLGAGGFGAVVATRLLRLDMMRPAVLWGALSMTLVAVSLEEISWGQRVLDIETPLALESNVQGELTLHNMPPVQRLLHAAYVVAGMVFGLGWWLRRQLTGVPRWLQGLLAWMVPPQWLTAFFLPVASFYLMLDWTPPHLVAGKLTLGFFSVHDQELVEFLLSAGLLLFAVDAFARVRAQSAPTDTSVHSRGRPAAEGRGFLILRPEFYATRLAGGLPRAFEPVRSRGRFRGAP
jgi:hypothetical protein